MINDTDRALIRALALPYHDARRWTQQFVDIARLPETLKGYEVLADLDPIDADALAEQVEQIRNLPEVS